MYSPPSIKDFGAVGDGVTDDTAAFVAAKAVCSPVFIPEGTYLLNSAFDSGDMPMVGVGAVLNPQAPSYFRSLIDFGKKAIARITARLPTEYTATPSAYTYVKDLVSFNLTHTSGAGYQGSFVDDSGGRTSVPAIYIEGYHYGYGDMPGVSAHIGVARHASWGSVTGWTGANSGVCYDGEVGAVTDNVNLYGAEFHLTDNAHARVAANGVVIDHNRTNSSPSNSGAYNTVWTAYRAQTSGTYASDSAYSINGKWNVGLDFSGATLTNGAALALKSNDKVYFGVPATTPPNWYASTLSGHYQVFDGTKIVYVVNSVPALQISDTTVLSNAMHTMMQSFNIPSSGNIASTVGAAGAAAALPAKPFTYLKIKIDGNVYKIPLYSN